MTTVAGDSGELRAPGAEGGINGDEASGTAGCEAKLRREDPVCTGRVVGAYVEQGPLAVKTPARARGHELEQTQPALPRVLRCPRMVESLYKIGVGKPHGIVCVYVPGKVQPAKNVDGQFFLKDLQSLEGKCDAFDIKSDLYLSQPPCGMRIPYKDGSCSGSGRSSGGGQYSSGDRVMVANGTAKNGPRLTLVQHGSLGRYGGDAGASQDVCSYHVRDHNCRCCA
ncbi:hypothetical protein HPB48_021874 [Haemaphysalis longicornis]|uniref:Uncharacterized protein n=1 Tax=Haemaphysalis longicornis TaxID=44386 RepID=A0A9J6FEZ9_HAELO|nr:hypothetical protein HPB48_021874 [Haemaphysalis longicornis]